MTIDKIDKVELNKKLSIEINKVFRGFSLNHDEVLRLINEGADANLKSKLGNLNVLHMALSNSHSHPKTPLFIKKAAELGADINAVSLIKKPLIFYAKNIEFIRLAIELGADAKALAGNNKTLFHSIIERHFEQKKEAFELLLESGVDINAKDSVGKTALFYVTTEENAKILIALGADVGVQSNDLSLLSFAITRGYSWLFEHVLKAAPELVNNSAPGKKQLAGAQQFAGFKPIHYATYTGSQYFLRRLIEQGADISERSTSGDTPLDIAKNLQIPEIEKIILDEIERIELVASSDRENCLERMFR